MKASSREQIIYVAVFLILGAALAAWWSFQPTAAAWPTGSSMGILLWMVMTTIAAMYPIPMPNHGGRVNLTTALDFGSILVFGPAAACWVVVFSRLVTGTVNRWTPRTRWLFEIGHAVVAVMAAGLTYRALGGATGTDLLGAPDQLPAVGAAALVFVALRSGLDAAEHAVSNPTTSGWTRVLQGQLRFDLVVLPFGILLALTQIRVGILGAALFLIPMLMTRYILTLWLRTKEAHVGIVRTLMNAVDAGDSFTRGLSHRISTMSIRVARHLGLSEQEVEEIEYAALLHDIGRTAIQRNILNKAGRLNEQEAAELRLHPKIGYDMLRDLNLFQGAAEIIYAHHEQPDGRGYPRGLHAERIPLGSGIIMVVAAFDAMTSDRPYRQGLEPEAAFEELLAHSGTQFFPEVVEALIELYSGGTLFDGFDAEDISRYAEEESHSRAMARYRDLIQASTVMPPKRGMSSLDSYAVEGGSDAIDFQVEPPGPPAGRSETATFVLEDGLRLVTAGMSDVGCIRENNEDSFGAFDRDPSDGCLLVVADGMGGAAAGEVASRLAVETVSEAYFRSAPGYDPANALERALGEANQDIRAHMEGDPETLGMGTTCTAVAVKGKRLHVGHVGDSRAYLIRNDEIRSLTMDHTLAVEIRQISSSASGGLAEANHVLTRCLGAEEAVEVDGLAESLELVAGDRVVLCSDGLTGQVTDDEILELAGAGSPETGCRQLVDLARTRGGPDNITVQIARVEWGA